MDVSIIVPMQASGPVGLPDCLTGILSRRYERGNTEVLVVRNGLGATAAVEPP